MIRVKILGLSAVDQRFRSLYGAALSNSVHAALGRGGVRVANEAQSLVASPPKTGRVYQRGTRAHQASAPGEPPATDTGRLSGSMMVSSRRTAGGSTVEIAATAPYAADLEFGNSRIEERPFMRPAVRNVLDDVVEDVVRAMRSRTRRR
jgi:hypothetical protein